VPKPTSKHNVLIAGATSVIGRQVVEQLYYDDRNVGHIMAVALESQKPYYFDEYDTARFSYHSLNILKPRELTNLFLSERFRDARIDTVLHLAFMHRSDASGGERHELNVDGTRAMLLKCAETEGIRKFVFLSSWDVYRLKPHNPVLLDERSDLNFAQRTHGWIKDRVDADMQCRAMMDHPRLQVVVLRPTGIVGRNVRLPMNEFLSSRICPMVAGFNPMVNLIHTFDVMRAIRCAVHRPVKGVFNVVGQETAPLSEFIRLAGRVSIHLPEVALNPFNALQRRLGLTQWDSTVYPERFKFSCLLDGKKAEDILGYKPTHHVKF
jgi:UDP-glucose 4-epimerase